MSRANRRRATSRVTAPAPAPRPVAGAPGATGAERHISWRHCLVGLVIGELVLLLVSNGGLALANVAFGSTDRIDGGITGMGTFVAVILGGFIAARLAGRWGVYQGTVVGIGFIAVGALYQFGLEASIVHGSLSSGSHRLVDLGPMDMGGVFSGDLLALFGGSVGGWLARRP